MWGAEYAVKMYHVTKTFGKVTANKDVNLELRTGEILALLGENGSGKTTLMNMLSGIYFPDHGGDLCEGERGDDSVRRKIPLLWGSG